MIVKPADVVEAAARLFSVSSRDIHGPSKCGSIADARRVAAWVLRHAGKLSWTQIAKSMGRECHTTAISWEQAAATRPHLLEAAIALKVDKYNRCLLCGCVLEVGGDVVGDPDDADDPHKWCVPCAILVRDYLIHQLAARGAA